MTAGLRIFNQATGSVQIDELFRSLSFRDKGTKTLAVGGGDGLHGFVYDTITVTAGLPIVVAAGANCFAYVGGYHDNGDGTWDVFLGCDAGSAGTDVNWWLFDAKGPVTDTFGLQVKNAAGEVVYHSSWKIMVVPTSVSGSPASGNHTWTSGHTYAAFQVDDFAFYNTDNFDTGFSIIHYYSTTGVKAITDGLSFGPVDVLNDTAAFDQNSTSSFLIVDTTGL